MQKFKETIQIEISVNSIANTLLANMSSEFPHAELVVETIIARALASDKASLSMLYNSLNGFTQEVDFNIGDVIVPHSLYAYGYWNGAKDQKREKILLAEVMEIDIYRDNKLKVSYLVPQSDGTNKVSTDWISHIDCKMAPSEFAAA